MNILIVSQYFWPENFRINDLATALKEKGHQVSVLTGLPNYPSGTLHPNYSFWRGPWKEEKDGMTIYRFPLITRGPKQGIRLILNYFSFAFFSSILAPIFVRKKYDIIFVPQLSPIFMGLPAFVLSKLHRTPVVFWITDLWPESLEFTKGVKSSLILAPIRALANWMYRHSKMVLVSSRGFIKRIVRHDAQVNNLVYWPYWAESYFSATPTSPEHLNEKVFLYAGNFGTAQDLHTIIKAAELLRDRSDIKIHFMGDGAEKKAMLNEVEKRRLDHMITFRQPCPTNEMPLHYSKAYALFVTLKRNELFSITVPSKTQSCLASGRPIVMSVPGEASDIIKESKAGICVEPENAESLANGIRQMADLSSSEWKVMAQNARQYYDQHFERTLLMDKLIDIFHQSIKDQSAINSR